MTEAIHTTTRSRRSGDTAGSCRRSIPTPKRTSWKLLEEKDIALVILDLKMPDTDGFTLSQDIRAIRDIPVVLMTGDRSCDIEADIRKEIGMTQEELAEALYVEKSIISYYENDKKEMRASGLAEIAKVLQTTPNYLLGFADNNDGFADEALGLLRDVKDQSVREILLKQIRALI